MIEASWNGGSTDLPKREPYRSPVPSARRRYLFSAAAQTGKPALPAADALDKHDAGECDRNGRAPRSCLAGGNPKHRFKIIVFSILSRYTARVTRMNTLGKSASASSVNREYLAPARIG
jgi:hypothetical protein